jgi:hypothetical protein
MNTKSTKHSEARNVEARTDTLASSVVVVVIMVSALCGAFAIDTEATTAQRADSSSVASAE